MSARPAPGGADPGRSRLRRRSGARAHQGLVRSRNEDAYLSDDGRGIWAVADGMGGHAHGQLASSRVVEALNYVRSGWTHPHALAQDVVSRLEEANQRLRERARAEGVSAIGSTVVAFVVFDSAGLVVWCGDSRAYQFRRGAPLRRLTRDHTVVQELVEGGSLREEHAENHPHAHILTRAVGAADRLELSFGEVELRPGDRLLLCSDGLTRPVPEPEIARIAASRADPEAACDALVEAALEAGGPDNVTVVLIDFA